MPAEPDDGIRCLLHDAKLEDARDTHEALSYVWGSPNDRTEIKCHDKPISITLSLADALRALRHRNTPRHLWADAICINQGDVLEKNHQVQLMGKVYEYAREVSVWLGNDLIPNESLRTALVSFGI